MADQPLTYHDFKIEMSDLKDDKTFKVRVMDATPTNQTMSDDEANAHRVTFNADDFTTLVGRLDRRKATKDELFELGAKLCGLLLPGRVRTLFDESLHWAEQNDKAIRLRLNVGPLPLSALPWEYTLVAGTVGEPTANDFIVLQRRVSLVRFENIGSVIPPLKGKDKLRAVLALASPSDQERLELSGDKKAIADAVAAANKLGPSIEAVWLNPATRSRISQITQADIFHFAGHGAFTVPNDGSFNRQGQIILETDDEKSDPYPSDELVGLLANAGTRLVVLGACESASRDEGGAWSGVAPALVHKKIPCVVAMQFKVANVAAGQFMPVLYGGMVAGLTIDEAVFEGRRAIFTQADNWAEMRDWGVPVLYLLAPDGNLFPLPPDETAGATDSPLVKVRQEYETIRGKLTGAELSAMFTGKADIVQTGKEVTEGGEVIGVKFGTLGGRRRQ